MHDLLLDHQDALAPARPDRLRRAARARRRALHATTCASTRGAARVAEDVDSADLSGVSGTPTFFINGRRHYGAYDIAHALGGRTGRGSAGDTDDRDLG